MGRKPLGWSAIVTGILGVLFFAVLIAVSLLARGALRDWANGYLEPADQSIERLAIRLSATAGHTTTAEGEVAELVATGSDLLLDAARTRVLRLRMDLIALEASIVSVDSGMDIIAALPLFSDEERGFQKTVVEHLQAIQADLGEASAELEEAQFLAAEIRAGGDGAEKARIALRALAGKIAPEIAAVRTFLGDLGTGLFEVRGHLGDAYDRIARGLTLGTIALCFIFAWLAIAHFCVYLAGKRLLEEDAEVGGR
jgi:hypothetical protein